jgi:hypothetical protein
VDTGPNSYNDGIVELGNAFNNHTDWNASGNPKIDWHGADSFSRNSAMPPLNFIGIEPDPNSDPF